MHLCVLVIFSGHKSVCMFRLLGFRLGEGLVTLNLSLDLLLYCYKSTASTGDGLGKYPGKLRKS